MWNLNEPLTRTFKTLTFRILNIKKKLAVSFQILAEQFSVSGRYWPIYKSLNFPEWKNKIQIQAFSHIMHALYKSTRNSLLTCIPTATSPACQNPEGFRQHIWFVHHFKMPIKHIRLLSSPGNVSEVAATDLYAVHLNNSSPVLEKSAL